MGVKSIKIFFILPWTLFLAFNVSAQSSILKKEVSVSFDNISVEKLLIYLSNEAGFNFSYNSGILNTDHPVSFHGQHVTVENVLKAVLPEVVHYSVSGDYLILLKERSAETKSEKNTRYEIRGYVYDSETGRAIANVSVFDASGLESVLSDSSGFYNLVLTSRYEQINLFYSKKNFLDTLIIVQPENQSLNLSLRPEPQAEFSKPPESLESIKSIPVEDLGFVRKFVSREQILQSENIRTVKTRVAQVSLWPKVGTNLKMSGFVENNLSLNILAGYAMGLNGVEVGGLANIDRKYVYGFQAAGLANIVGGQVSGVQIGGLINHNSSGMTGLQVAGINNVVLNDIRGVQISGINNVLKGSMKGLQLAGINNFTSENVNGVQIAGISNITLKDVDLLQVGGLFNVGNRIGGVQVAGLINFARRSVGGFQVGGLINTALDTVEGVQLAGLFNYSKTVKAGQFSGIGNIASENVSGLQLAGIINYGREVNGGQIGLINIAGSESGIPVGLISFVRKGYHKLEISSEEALPANLTWKMGVRRFYNIFSGGFRSSIIYGKDAWGFGYGIGTQIGMRKITVNLDFRATWFVENVNISNYAISYRFNPELTWNFTNHLALFAGPALVLYSCDSNSQETINFISDLVPYINSLWEKTTSYDVFLQLGTGGSIGLRFF